jgi:hypothetical protein
MAQDVAGEIIRHQGLLKSQQANFSRYWEEIAYYVMPPHATFLVQPSEGLKRTERLFDQTAVSANERFGAAIEQMLTPRTQEWHGMSSRNPQLADSQKVQSFFEQFTQTLFALRYRPKANFASQTHECYMSLGAFGNMALFIDEQLGSGIRYRTTPMQELTWAQDHQGRVDTVYRKFKLEARQFEQQFPGRPIPKAILDALKTNPYAEFEFIHSVRPNTERDSTRRDFRGMAHSSHYVMVVDQVLVDEGGYRTFPYAIGRYTMAPRENYGRGPAMACFAAIRTLNEEKKTVLRAGQKSVEPAILLYEEGVLEAFNQRSGAMNYGMLSADGEELAKPFKIDANIPLGLELMKLEAQAVNDAFLTTLFQILVDNPEMTATEALIRSQEKGMLLAPTMGRQQSEFLGPLIEREIDLCYHSPSLRAMLPPIPDELLETGGFFDIEYKSPLTKSMRAAEGTAIMQTVQSIGVLAQIDPSVTDLFDMDKTAKRVAEINGFPADCYKTDDELEAARTARANQQVASAVTQAAPQLSVAAKNLGQARQAEAMADTAGAPSAAAQPQAA